MQQEFSLSREIRSLFEQEIENLSLEQLNHIPPTHNNNIFWNITHCIAIQQSLCYRLSNLPTSVELELVKAYRRGTKPEQAVHQELVDRVHGLLQKSVDWLERDWMEGVFEQYTPYTVALGTHLTNINQAITFNNVHEGIHYGYILALKKLL